MAAATNLTLTPVEALTGPEIIDSKELALRLNLPESWIRDQVRRRATEPIPHLRFGKYVRFAWGSPELSEWLQKRSSGSCAGARRS